ncbi:MAG: hypothetical protein CUN52_15085, partial [Phototrophicales bacterium]
MMQTTTIQQIDHDNALALDMSQTKLDDALILAQCTYKSATEIGYDKGIADSLLAQAQVNYHHAHYEHALLQLGRALAIYENLPDLAKSAHAFTMMGNIFRQIGDFSSAIDAFSKSLNAARALNDQLAEMRALNGLASIYGHSHQPS